ncbi:hypothetical protein [Sneathiella glossodoripedis]|uniref:hypothetical protein n=1 Tax=Sneathiella glossodoripedis TaxID=418853 RepID=UPI00046FE2C1|nr:hypothetical protein [Sneathiella glossodoripedis]
MFKLVSSALLLISIHASSLFAATVNIDLRIDGEVSNGIYNYNDFLRINSESQENAIFRSETGLGVGDSFFSKGEKIIFRFAEPILRPCFLYSCASISLKAEFQLTENSEGNPQIIPEPTPIGENSSDYGISLNVYSNLLIRSVSFEFDPTQDDKKVTFLETTWREPELIATPLPAAFSLYAAGMGILGLLGWRRKKKPLLL